MLLFFYTRFTNSSRSTSKSSKPALGPLPRQSVPVSRERTSSHGIPLKGRYSCLVSRPPPEEPQKRWSSHRDSLNEVDRLRSENTRLRETVDKQTVFVREESNV